MESIDDCFLADLICTMLQIENQDEYQLILSAVSGLEGTQVKTTIDTILQINDATNFRLLEHEN